MVVVQGNIKSLAKNLLSLYDFPQDATIFNYSVATKTTNSYFLPTGKNHKSHSEPVMKYSTGTTEDSCWLCIPDFFQLSLSKWYFLLCYFSWCCGPVSMLEFLLVSPRSANNLGFSQNYSLHYEKKQKPISLSIWSGWGRIPEENNEINYSILTSQSNFS